MTRARLWPLLAAIAVAAVLSFGFSAHGLPQLSAHDGMAGASAGLCLLLVTMVGYAAAAPKLQPRYSAVVEEAVPSYVGPPRRPPLDGRARASPSALQRFRN